MNDWISVKDRLPEDDEICVVYRKNNEYAFAFYMGHDRVIKEGWYIYLEETVERIDKVTHWMPLPELPK